MRYLTGLLLLFTFTSCEGYFHLEGKALDSNSGLPISDARFTFIVEEKDTTPLKCSIIERESIRAEERIKLRKKILPIHLQDAIKQVFINIAIRSYMRTGALTWEAGYLM